MKFKKGDIVMVVDPTFDWITEEYREFAYGIEAEVVNATDKACIVVKHGGLEFMPDWVREFCYQEKSLEKLPAMNVLE